MSQTIEQPPMIEGPSPEDLKLARRATRRFGLFAPHLMRAALETVVCHAAPDIQWKNPVMFVVEVGTVLSIVFTLAQVFGYPSQVRMSLLARARHLALSDGPLRQLRDGIGRSPRQGPGRFASQNAARDARLPPVRRRHDRRDGLDFARAGDRVVVEAGQIIPGDGEIVEGIASVDESAITGESAPVVREAGGDRSGVTGGTRVLSDRIVVKITAGAGNSFLDRMIALVEGAIRQRTPNEIALSLVLSAFTLIFLIVTAALWPMARNAELYMQSYLGTSQPLHSLGTDIPTLVGLLVCLIPTTIGALLAAIGIAGMDRALRANVLAKSGKAVEVAGDIDTLLLDKTGTITMGNRRASQFVPLGDYTAAQLGELAAVASVADQTPEGKSIVDLYRNLAIDAGMKLRTTAVESLVPTGSRFIEFTAQTRMSGIDLPDGRQIRKGATDTVMQLRPEAERPASRRCTDRSTRSPRGGDAFAGLRRRQARRPGRARGRVETRHARPLRAAPPHGPPHGDGDGRQSADGQGDRRPGRRRRLHRPGHARGEARLHPQGAGRRQARGHDGRRHQRRPGPGAGRRRRRHELRHAGGQRGRQHGRPRQRSDQADRGRRNRQATPHDAGALTTFSIANDLAKYFAIVPALFAATLPWLKAFDIMHLHSATSAILSAVIFNAIIIPLLIPIALKGVTTSRWGPTPSCGGTCSSGDWAA